MSRITRPYTFDIAANSFASLPVHGDGIRIQTITASATVTIKTDAGDSIEGMGLAQKYRFAEEFSHLIIENDTAGAITVTALIGFGNFSDRQITGTVTIDSSTPVNVSLPVPRAMALSCLSMFGN